jgi:hypothetical protein
MKRIGILLLLAFILAAAAVRPVFAQTAPVLLAPGQGDVLQGLVTIRGTSALTGFISSELAFSYVGDPTGTWFLIVESNQPVDSDALATWDATTITDGNYSLRLRVTLADGSHLDAFIPDVRVRNYTPVETPTPAPTAAQPTFTPTFTLTATPFPSPTPLPHNPAVLTPSDVSVSIVYGGLGAVLLLIILGIYLRLRQK